MNVFLRLLELVSPSSSEPDAAVAGAAGGGEPPRPLSRLERIFFASIALLAAVGLGGLWGVAAGSHDQHLAFDNFGKVPVLLVGSSLVALPVALFVFRLTAKRGRATDLVLAHAVGIFAGCLALALLAPLVALYQYSSSFAGMPVAIASAGVAVAVAVGVVVRVLRKLAPEGTLSSYGAPVLLLLTLQLAAIAQLAAVATPVFPTRTAMGRGVDGWVQATPAAPATPAEKP